MAALARLARALVTAGLLAGVVIATPAVDAETKCKRDSDGHLVCVKVDRAKAERCTLTCKKDAAGRTVCRERCR